MALLRSAATVGGFTLMSRILGFLRDALIAAYLGAGPVADAFFVAFKLPNFFRSLFAEGAFNSAFVPLYSDILTREGRAAAITFAERALSVLLAALFLFVALCQIVMPWLMLGLAPGFADEPERFNLAVALTRLTFPYLLFISLVSLLAGVLNSVGRFAAGAAAPVLLNLTLIATLLAAGGDTLASGYALAAGITLAGIVQFLWLLAAAARAGIVPRLPRPRLTPEVRHLLRLILPAALGAGVVQINLVVGVILASLLPAGSISYLFYADRLNQLPIGVVGVAVGTALLPLISRQISAGDEAAARASQNRAIELTLLLGLPAALALITVPHELIAVLFQRGAFGSEATQATAAALAAYALGLPAYVLVKALAPGFYGRKDTSTPVKIAALCILVNIALSVLLMTPLRHVGLALAAAVAAWLNAILLATTLWRRGLWQPDDRLKSRAWRIALAGAAMAAVLAGSAAAMRDLFAGPLSARLLGLVLLVAGGLASYGLCAALAGAVRFGELMGYFRRPRGSGGPISQNL